MYNFERNNFHQMTTEEKINFVNKLVHLKVELSEEEMKYLTGSNKDIYLYNISRSSDWLKDYEFESLPEKEKIIYISKKRFIGKENFKNLSPELQEKYVLKAAVSGVQLPEEIFDSLKSDELRKKYVYEKSKFSTNSNLTAKELCYLPEDEQIEYVRLISKMGLTLKKEEIKSLKPKALRAFMSKHYLMREVRQLIKSELKKILF